MEVGAMIEVLAGLARFFAYSALTIGTLGVVAAVAVGFTLSSGREPSKRSLIACALLLSVAVTLALMAQSAVTLTATAAAAEAINAANEAMRGLPSGR